MYSSELGDLGATTLPGPLTILLDSPILLNMSWFQLFYITLDRVSPCADDIHDGQLEYICNTWTRLADERPDEEQTLFLRGALIIATLADNPLLRDYFAGMRMRLQVAYAMLEMKALAFGFI